MVSDFKEYLKLKGMAAVTIQNYYYLARMLDRSGEITQEVIDRFCIDHPYSSTRSTILHYLKYLEIKGIKVPKIKEKTTEVMSDLGGYIDIEKVDLILSKAKSRRDFLLFLLLFRCGRRVSEILPLKVNDIDFEQGVILFKILKKKRDFPKYKAVDDQTISLLKKYIEDSGLDGEDYLFTGHQTKKPITRQMCDILFKEMAEKAGITRVGEKKPHCHHLRHSHAINFLKRTNSPYGLKIVQQQLEHSNLKSTGVYLQFSQKDQKEMLNKAFVK